MCSHYIVHPNHVVVNKYTIPNELPVYYYSACDTHSKNSKLKNSKKTKKQNVFYYDVGMHLQVVLSVFPTRIHTYRCVVIGVVIVI